MGLMARTRPVRKSKSRLLPAHDSQNTRPTSHVLPCQSCLLELVKNPSLECSGAGSETCTRCKRKGKRTTGCREIPEELHVLAWQTLEKVRFHVTGWKDAVLVMGEAIVRHYQVHCVSHPTQNTSYKESSDSTSGLAAGPTADTTSGPATENPVAAQQSLRELPTSFGLTTVLPPCGPTCGNRPIGNSSAVTGFDPELTRLMKGVQDAARALDDYLHMRGYV